MEFVMKASEKEQLIEKGNLNQNQKSSMQKLSRDSKAQKL